MRVAFTSIVLVLAASIAFGAPAAKKSAAASKKSAAAISKNFDCSIVKSSPDDDSFRGVAPKGKTAFLKLFGSGTLNYACTKGNFTLVEPKIDLFLDESKKTKVGFHGFEGGNPFWEAGSNGVCGKMVMKVDDSSVIAAPQPAKDVEWFRTNKISSSGGAPLSSVQNIIRAQTHGGVAPKTCKDGAKINVPLSTTYAFYK